MYSLSTAKNVKKEVTGLHVSIWFWKSVSSLIHEAYLTMSHLPFPVSVIIYLTDNMVSRRERQK